MHVTLEVVMLHAIKYEHPYDASSVYGHLYTEKTKQRRII